MITKLKFEQYVENLRPKPKLELMSMADLSRLARNEGEDRALRCQALEMLNRRERNFFSKHYYGGLGKGRVLNYAPGL